MNSRDLTSFAVGVLLCSGSAAVLAGCAWLPGCADSEAELLQLSSALTDGMSGLNPLGIDTGACSSGGPATLRWSYDGKLDELRQQIDVSPASCSEISDDIETSFDFYYQCGEGLQGFYAEAIDSDGVVTLAVWRE